MRVCARHSQGRVASADQLLDDGLRAGSQGNGAVRGLHESGNTSSCVDHDGKRTRPESASERMGSRGDVCAVRVERRLVCHQPGNGLCELAMLE